MTDTQLADTATDYLARLDSALAGVDPATRAEILSAVREELAGLPAAVAAERIRAIGDPAFVAAEARGALPGSAGEPAVSALEPASATGSGSAPAPASAKAEPAWFAVLAGLLVMLGGVVVPVVGALAGYVMVWLSSAWTRRQKLIATAAPLVYFAVVALAAALATSATPRAPGPSTGSAGSGAAEAGAALNPLLPAGYDLLWSGTLLLAVVQFGVGAWLLVAARRNRMRPAG